MKRIIEFFKNVNKGMLVSLLLVAVPIEVLLCGACVLFGWSVFATMFLFLIALDAAVLLWAVEELFNKNDRL